MFSVDKNATIYVAGHTGMVGSAIVRRLKACGYKKLITRNHKDLDLVSQHSVVNFFQENKPDVVFLAAAKVGGIQANNRYRGQFIYENIMIQANVIHAAYTFGVKRLIFLGSSCIYPRDCEQPIKEDYLLTGALEHTNEPYAIAKISGLKLCESYNDQYGTDFVCLMPTNLYGPNDNYDLETSHVLPALMRKIHEAKLSGSKEFLMWGSGTPRREFLHVDDLAGASVFTMECPEARAGLFNVGCGADISILGLARKIMGIVEFDGVVNLDSSKPDGTPRKLLDITKIGKLGWRAEISLDDGLKSVYKDFLTNYVTK